MSEIKYDKKSGIIGYEDKAVFLTKKENIIMKMLFDNYPRIILQKEMVKAIYGEKLDYYNKRCILTNISRLRKKLKVFGDKIQIKTIHGFGNVLILKD